MTKLMAISLCILISTTTTSILAHAENIQINVAGAIRNPDGSGWKAINDAGHTPLNIKNIEVINGAIVVHYDFKATTIHSFIAAPDETFALAGIMSGASVNRDRATIILSKIVNGKVVRLDASKVQAKFGNIWLYGLFSTQIKKSPHLPQK